MQQILLGIILVLGIGCYWLYNENNTIKANNIALEGAIATQEEAISTLQNDFAVQATQLQNMTLKSQAAQRELNRYTQFIQNYQLTAKILTDPVEMQRKINNGTKHIMEDIEKISVTVDDLPTKQIQVTAKPVERTIVQPIMPREIDLKEVRWLTITPENFEEQFQVIEDQEGELVFLAMTVPDYEVMAYNMQEIKRYITELKDVVVYYRTVTTEQDKADE